MGHKSNGVIHEWGIAQMVSLTNGALVKWDHSPMGHFSNGVIHKWGISQIGSFTSRILVE